MDSTQSRMIRHYADTLDDMFLMSSDRNNKFKIQPARKDLQSAKENLGKAYFEPNQDYLQRQIDEIREGSKEKKNTSSAWKAINNITERANEGQVKGRSQQERLGSWYNAFY